MHSNNPLNLIVAHQSILVWRATDRDFEFIDSVTNDSKVPEYAGFNTRMSREENHSLKPGASVAYSSLIERLWCREILRQ